MSDRRDDAPWGAHPPDAGADPERLAALLDGRLEDAERDRLLARLAADGDDLALYAEAAAIQRALEEEDAAVLAPASAPPHTAPPPADPAPEPGVVRLRRPIRGVDRRLALLAAVLAGVTLLPLAWRASRPGAVSSPAQAVAMLESRDGGLPAGSDERPWVRTRGGGDPLAGRSRAARVGALAVDLELALRAGDVEEGKRLAGEIHVALEDAPAVAGTGFASLAGSPSTDRGELLAELESAMERATGFVDADFVAIGGWAEAARLAVLRGDAAFFRSRRTEGTLARAQSLLAGDDAAASALRAIAAARASDPPDWPALREAVDTLLYAIAS